MLRVLHEALDPASHPLRKLIKPIPAIVDFSGSFPVKESTRIRDLRKSSAHTGHWRRVYEVGIPLRRGFP